MEETIMQELNHKTRVIITNSLQYTKYADRVMIFKNGNLVQNGSYQSVVKSQDYAEFSKVINDKELDQTQDQHEKTIEEQSFMTITDKSSLPLKLKRSELGSTEKLISETDKQKKEKPEVKKELPEGKKVLDHFLDEDRATGSVSFKYIKYVVTFIGGWCTMLAIFLESGLYEYLKNWLYRFLTTWSKNFYVDDKWEKFT